MLEFSVFCDPEKLFGSQSDCLYITGRRCCRWWCSQKAMMKGLYTSRFEKLRMARVEKRQTSRSRRKSWELYHDWTLLCHAAPLEFSIMFFSPHTLGPGLNLNWWPFDGLFRCFNPQGGRSVGHSDPPSVDLIAIQVDRWSFCWWK